MKVRLAFIVALVAAAGSQLAAGPPWPDEAYRVEWMAAHIPDEVAPSVRLAIPVTLRNAGDQVWPASQVFVSYHWLRDERLAVWDGQRTPLPRDLRGGSRAALSAHVVTPAEQGTYKLVLTLVHENVTWFEHKGAATATRSITVRQPTRSADTSTEAPVP